MPHPISLFCVYVALASALLCSCAARAQGAVESVENASQTLDLTLEGAVELALGNSRVLANQRLGRVIERYTLRVAENEFRPRVTIGAFGLNNEVGDANTETSGILSGVRMRVPTGGEFSLTSRAEDLGLGGGDGISTHGSNVDFTFRQPLLRGGGLKVGGADLRNARRREEINVLAFKSTIIDLTSRVVRAYWTYVQAGRRVDIATRSLERAQDLLEVNKLLVQTGRMAERDVVQAEADIARRELDVISAEGSVDAARMSLIDILDIDSDTRFGSTDVLTVDDVPASTPDADAGTDTALEMRPDYLRALLGLSIAETRVAVAKNARLWDLSLTLGTRLEGDGDALVGAARDLDRTGRRVALDLSVPVGRAASDPAKLEHESAVAALAIARNNLDDLRQRINIEVRNAVRDVELARRGVVLAETARALAERKTEVEREKLSLGLSTNFQLVAFENDLVLAENAELDAKARLLNAVTELERTLGTTLERWQIDVKQVEFEYGDE
ncbi:MAG: TolC family protein [Gammaproteobacteria bacterium]|nr:TolC family protein [Gammaproteobacteria bacterium]